MKQMLLATEPTPQHPYFDMKKEATFLNSFKFSMPRHGSCLCQPTNSSSSLRKIEWLSVLALARQNYHSLTSCWTATEVITNLPTAWFNLILTLNGIQVMTQDLILFKWEDACVSYMTLLGVISYWLSPLYCPSDSQVHTHNLIFHREIEGKIPLKHIKMGSLLCYILFWKK